MDEGDIIDYSKASFKEFSAHMSDIHGDSFSEGFKLLEENYE